MTKRVGGHGGLIFGQPEEALTYVSLHPHARACVRMCVRMCVRACVPPRYRTPVVQRVEVEVQDA